MPSEGAADGADGFQVLPSEWGQSVTGGPGWLVGLLTAEYIFLEHPLCCTGCLAFKGCP